jgi:hypothetical protein
MTGRMSWKSGSNSLVQTSDRTLTAVASFASMTVRRSTRTARVSKPPCRAPVTLSPLWPTSTERSYRPGSVGALSSAKHPPNRVRQGRGSTFERRRPRHGSAAQLKPVSTDCRGNGIRTPRGLYPKASSE